MYALESEVLGNGQTLDKTVRGELPGQAIGSLVPARFRYRRRYVHGKIHWRNTKSTNEEFSIGATRTTCRQPGVLLTHKVSVLDDTHDGRKVDRA